MIIIPSLISMNSTLCHEPSHKASKGCASMGCWD
uniref:Uncharacterized protein n=1 Tax=Rhizophora mucronata TaxID=61149 RepID=A0A2P2NK43_RHIMU